MRAACNSQASLLACHNNKVWALQRYCHTSVIGDRISLQSWWIDAAWFFKFQSKTNEIFISLATSLWVSVRKNNTKRTKVLTATKELAMKKNKKKIKFILDNNKEKQKGSNRNQQKDKFAVVRITRNKKQFGINKGSGECREVIN